MIERGYRILVVDDEPDLEPLILQRMRRSIRSGHYSFVFARNGVEALEQLSQDRDIDMVLSDINMPQMDGLTLLESDFYERARFRCRNLSVHLVR